MSTLKLNNNLEIPQIGFGTANLGSRDQTKIAIQAALDIGYRRFDTASFYNNEKELGEVIASNLDNIPREDIIIGTKLWNSDHGYDSTKNAVSKSLKKLNLDYIDIYLTHWPVPQKRKDSWKAMEELYNEGIIKAIGVSNYTVKHLMEVIDSGTVMPTINQVEFNPFLYQKDLLDFCKKHNIILEAYSPILACVRKRADNSVLNEIAIKHNKSIAQIAIKWSMQLGNSVIPRSSNQDRIRENFDVFDFVLSNEEMDRLNNLNEDLRLEWDPTNEP